MTMIAELMEFAGLLRKNGVRLSTAEVLDAVSAAGVIGLGDGASLREALRTTLCKRREDEEVFTELFGLYFLRASAFADREDAPLLQALRAEGVSEEQLEHILAILA